MEMYYAKLARGILFKAEREIGKAQNYLVDGDATDDLLNSSKLLLDEVRSLQDDILKAAEEYQAMIRG